MNKFAAVTLGGLLLLALSVNAQQPKPDEHAAHHPAGETPAQAKSSPPDDMPMRHMQNNMKKMQDLMGKIQASKDPKEVELLLEEHMKMMREQMKGMRGMMGKGMMGGGMKGGPKEGGMMMGGDMMKNHEAMMEHMHMMHGMMEQMMEHMQAEHHMMQPSADKKK